MNNENNNLQLLEIISDDSNNSIDFQPTARYISLMPNGLSVEKVKTKKKKLVKKKTRVSSNNDEDIEYSANENENDNDNENNNLNIQLTDNNACNNSDNNIIISHHKKNSFLYSSVSNQNFNDLNKYNKVNKSEIENINDEEKMILHKKSHFSPDKKKIRIFLEEKTKNRGQKRRIYALEQKEEKKEEEKKIYRKDKNGTEICKKNKKKVKIAFSEPLVNVIPIESFKHYNVTFGMPKGEKYIKSKDECLCCLIF